MDQESFRRFLQTPRPDSGSSQQHSRGSLLAAAKKAKTVDPSESKPAFKPRKVKRKEDSKYRDRAAERRHGDDNDFAHVEAVLHEFEKQAADTEDKDEVEEKRKYLGGDSEHSVLVKGLDFALLEQNKAKAVLSTDDVDALEAAFQEGSSLHAPENNATDIPTSKPKKRTREELLRELKESRAKSTPGPEPAVKTVNDEVKRLEEAKQKGKFKPIGFKPIGSSATEGKKKAKGDGTERKKKKRKIEDSKPTQSHATSTDVASQLTSQANAPTKPTAKTSQPEEPMDEDFDIFGGLDEYQGVEIGDEEGEESEGEQESSKKVKEQLEEGEEPADPPRRWIDIDEPEHVRKPALPLSILQGKQLESASQSPPAGNMAGESDDEMGEVRPVRLQPLASSALPSIKELLAMDDASGSRKKGKQKKKPKKKGKDDDDDD